MKIHTPVGPLFTTRSLAANDGAGHMPNDYVCIDLMIVCSIWLSRVWSMTCFKFLHIWSVYQTLQVMLNAPLLTLVRSCGTSAEILNHLVASWKQRWLAFRSHAVRLPGIRGFPKPMVNPWFWGSNQKKKTIWMMENTWWINNGSWKLKNRRWVNGNILGLYIIKFLWSSGKTRRILGSVGEWLRLKLGCWQS